MITSSKNPRLKDIRRARACKDDRALLEGPHLVEEAIRSGLELETLLATPDFLASAAGRALEPLLPRRPLEVAPELLESVTDADSPRGIVTTTILPQCGIETLPEIKGGVYVFAEGLQDPGNLGALARIAEASGAAALCLAPGSAHSRHPRALRASAGSLLRLPAIQTAGAEEVDEKLRALEPKWLALIPRGGEDLYSASLEGTLIVAVGAEGPGLSESLRRRADLEVTIPLAGEVESLNAAVAAAVVLFELRRKRSGLG